MRTHELIIRRLEAKGWDYVLFRVHRLGQTRTVQVVNFVAQGTIEEGMLSVLAFKKSLFANVLDGGAKDVFLHGTRLSKFMESVDKVTGATGAAQAPEDRAAAAADAESEAAGGVAQGDGPDEEDAVALEASASSPARELTDSPRDPWAPLIEAGLKFVESLSAARTTTDAQETRMPPWKIETDGRSGKSYLKLPVPEPATVQRLADALAGLLAGSGRR